MFIAAEVGKAAHRLRDADLPADVLLKAKLHTLDVLGVIMTARKTAFAHGLAAALPPCDGGGRMATMLGRDVRAAPESAAFYNAALAHASEFDDTYPPGRWHGSAVTIPAALASAEECNGSGLQYLRAVAIGLELGCRLTRLGPGMLTRGFHSTSVAGVFTGALAAALLAGHDADALARTLQICGSFASGTAQFLHDPDPQLKPLQSGHAARDALTATRLSAQGLRGPSDVFEGRHGYFQLFCGMTVSDSGCVMDGFGEEWHMLDLCPKNYPCDHLAQGYVDCAIEARGDPGFDVAAIESVECIVHPLVVPVMFTPPAMRYTPENGRSARWSMPFNVAVALLDGELGIDSYTDERVADSGTLALMAKVVPVEDAALRFPDDYPAWLRIRMADGTIIERQALKVRGSRERPLTIEEYRAKFRRNLERAGLADRAEAIASGVIDLESVTGIGTILRR